MKFVVKKILPNLVDVFWGEDGWHPQEWVKMFKSKTDNNWYKSTYSQRETVYSEEEVRFVLLYKVYKEVQEYLKNERY